MSTWTKRRALTAKGWSGIVLAAIVLAVALPFVISVQSREWIDQGARPLVIIATQGGERGYSAQVRSKVDIDGQYSFTFYLFTDDKKDGELRRFEVDYQIMVIGDGVDGRVQCGVDSSAIRRVAVDDLDAGAEYAYLLDRASARSSATNYRNPASEGIHVEPGSSSDAAAEPSPVPSPTSEAVDEPDVMQVAGKIWTWHEDERPPQSGSSVNGNGAIFAEHCTLSRELVWSSTNPGDPMRSVQATFLPPQFNLTSVGEATDFQTDFDVRLLVDRGDGVTMPEAYPAPVARASGWMLWYDVTWRAKRGEPRNLAYTDQPTWLFTNRGVARQEQSMLLFAGMGLGLALTLIVRGVSDLVDASVKDDWRPPGDGPVNVPGSSAARGSA